MYFLPFKLNSPAWRLLFAIYSLSDPLVDKPGLEPFLSPPRIGQMIVIPLTFAQFGGLTTSFDAQRVLDRQPIILVPTRRIERRTYSLQVNCSAN